MAQSFIQKGLQKIQRTLRVPAMEKSIVATIGSLYSSGLPVPGDHLELISISDVAEATELTRRPLREVIEQVEYGSGHPLIYCRRGSKYLIGPTPVEGKQLRIDYYAQFSALSADSDSNVITSVAPDLVTYAALHYGGQHFGHKRAGEWTAMYHEIFGDLMKQGEDDELTGNAQVAPAFRLDLDDI
jgi:hypothetical protein